MSVASEDAFRGYSLSHRRPVATLDLSYDQGTGAYIGSAATAVATPRSGIELLTLQLNMGYARPIGSRTTLDIGFTRSDFGRYASGDRKAHYDEVYIGAIAGGLASHLYYSQDYLRSGLRTLYLDVDAGRRLSKDWRLSSHVGALNQFTRPLGRRLQYDWRFGIARHLGWVEIQAALAGGGPGPDLAVGQPRSRTSLVLGVSRAF